MRVQKYGGEEGREERENISVKKLVSSYGIVGRGRRDDREEGGEEGDGRIAFRF